MHRSPPLRQLGEPRPESPTSPVLPCPLRRSALSKVRASSNTTDCTAADVRPGNRPRTFTSATTVSFTGAASPPFAAARNRAVDHADLRRAPLEGIIEAGGVI